MSWGTPCQRQPLFHFFGNRQKKKWCWNFNKITSCSTKQLTMSSWQLLTGKWGRGTRPLALALSCISLRCCFRYLYGGIPSLQRQGNGSGHSRIRKQSGKKEEKRRKKKEKKRKKKRKKRKQSGGFLPCCTYMLLSVSESVSASLDMLCCSLSLALVAGALA